MFTIISIMFIGIGIGYLMRNVQMLQKVEKSASLTILLLLFVLGVSIGSNRLIVDNLGRFGSVSYTHLVEARRYGVSIVGSEIIGLVPRGVTTRVLNIIRFSVIKPLS